MKLLYRILCVLMAAATCQASVAQCTAASLNWDALHFLPEGTNVSNAIATNQKFAFGENKLTITHNYTAANAVGENITNTAETGSYGAGADVQFTGNGTITLTFATAVQNVQFSMYDIDFGQKATITALNGTTAQNVSIATIGTSNVIVTGSGTTSATAHADSTITTKTAGNKTTTTVTYNSIANTATAGTINVNVTGPVTSIKIVVSNTQVGGNTDDDGSFWLSDIAACIINAAFPTAYGAISKPYTGQPGYVLAARNNEVYMVDPATGVSKLMFADPSLKNINSMGYDPYNKILYYTYSLTGTNNTVNPNDKAINKYDFNTGTYGTFVSDVTTLGVPVFGSGVESGGAAFYDGAFYIGIEGNSSSATDQSIVWRIDMDASGNATTATQVFASLTANHDWGDFVITNGTLYDFDGKQTKQDIYHLSLQTGALTDYPVSPDSVGQVAADWNGSIYNIDASSTNTAIVTPYRGNGKFMPSAQKTVTVSGTAITGSWGDAASAFKPKSDFGDAPATYDPDPLAPAMHDPDVNLRIGATLDYEWSKPTTLGVNADADGTDEDGLPYTRILLTSGNYQTDVSVYNNTGASATLAAWIDFNNDGVFQSSEGIVQTVASSTSMQTKSLYWTGITSSLSANSYTYLRIRITSAANNMTAANASGFFANGEVEDYYLPVNNSVLAVNPVHFAAKKSGEANVNITWTSTGEANTTYELERSADGQNWTTIYKQTITDVPASNAPYLFTDVHPVKPTSQYRLRYSTAMQRVQYSQIEHVTFSNTHAFTVYPNPATSHYTIAVSAQHAGSGTLELHDMSGSTVFMKTVTLEKGPNTLVIPVPAPLPAGVYSLVLNVPDALYTNKLLIRK